MRITLRRCAFGTDADDQGRRWSYACTDDQGRRWSYFGTTFRAGEDCAICGKRIWNGWCLVEGVTDLHVSRYVCRSHAQTGEPEPPPAH